jgi:uncharacterized protein (TIGR03083 family)
MMAKAPENKDFWLGALRAEGEAFRVAVVDADLDTRVPSCPEWTVADLVRHLGVIYQHLAQHVVRGVTDPPEVPIWEQPGPPDGADLVAWWDERYRGIVTLLDSLDPEQPAWNWASQSKRVAFWDRRLAHETAIHRWDAQFATINAEPIEPKLAADGIAEVLDTWLPAGRRKGPTDVAGVVGLIATDLEHEWLVRLRAGGGVALLDTDTLLDTDAHHQRAVARGSASDLLLVLYGRIDADVLDLSGDERLLDGLRVG